MCCFSTQTVLHCSGWRWNYCYWYIWFYNSSYYKYALVCAKLVGCYDLSLHMFVYFVCRVNCSFYFKIGACRHGERCSRLHNKPTFSQVRLIVQHVLYYGRRIFRIFGEEVGVISVQFSCTCAPSQYLVIWNCVPPKHVCLFIIVSCDFFSFQPVHCIWKIEAVY